MELNIYKQKSLFADDFETVRELKPTSSSKSTFEPEYPLHNRCQKLHASSQSEALRTWILEKANLKA